MFLKLDLLHLFLQGIPEAIAMVAAVYAINNYQFNWKNILIIGVLEGLTIYLIRLLPITYGLHSVFALITLSFYIQVFTKDKIIKIIMASVIVALFLALLEIIIYTPILKILGISIVEANENSLLWLLLAWPQVIVLFVTAFLISRFKNRRKKISIEGR